ncbi:MAG: transcription elongation factor GreA [Solirubrobacterales bacterium]|nr:transcription elongation factor GreA [Solirubrobacterales bacterium]
MSSLEPVLMTAEDLRALEAEIARLETTARQEIAARISTAREWGDLKENSEYHDAKNDQAMLETRILLLREKQLAAEIREVETQTDTVGFGSRVSLSDDRGKEMVYTLVAVTEARPAEGRLSVESPIGRALQGARKGDRVSVPTPRGDRELTVVSIG